MEKLCINCKNNEIGVANIACASCNKGYSNFQPMLEVIQEQTIYKQAIEKFGDENQILMAIQEMSELTKELTNHVIGRFDRVIDLPAEIADVEIMIEQLKIIFKIYNIVELKKEEKLKRLEKLISE